MKIINSQEKQNLLLDRKEVRIDVEADITPSRFECINAVVEKFSCPKDVVNIIRVDSNFGTKVFTIVADIYGSKESKESIAIKRKKEIQAEVKVNEEKKKIEEEKQAEKIAEEVPSNQVGLEEEIKEVPSEEVKEGKENKE